MRTSFVLGACLMLSLPVVVPTEVLAQRADLAQQPLLEAQVSTAGVNLAPRYLLSPMRSYCEDDYCTDTSVTLTNQKNSDCLVSLTARNEDGTTAATLEITLLAHQTVDVCSYGLPRHVEVCEHNLGLTGNYGTILVGVVNGCDGSLVVTARLLHYDAFSPSELHAMSDIKVLRYGKSNIGD